MTRYLRLLGWTNDVSSTHTMGIHTDTVKAVRRGFCMSAILYEATMGRFRNTYQWALTKARMRPVQDKTWDNSQQYEWQATEDFMKTQSFQELARDIHSGKLAISNGYRDSRIIAEFFQSDSDEYERFLLKIAGSTCLDIGPCVASPLSQWDHVANKFIIEPLAPRVEAWQKEFFGFSLFEGMTCIVSPAEVTQEVLLDRVNDAIYCRNCLDHSPNWAFILGNIGRYATSGCHLLYWSDLYHGSAVDAGHYNITNDQQSFRNLIVALGFDIRYEFALGDRGGLNWGCRAVKK